MNTGHRHIINPVETEDGSYTLRNEHFGATYHATQGAMGESRHVFIENGLLRYIDAHASDRYRILEIGFGTGLNAFLTFLEAKKRQLYVDYEAVELYPVPLETARQLNFTGNHSAAEQALFEKLHESAWDEKVVLSELFELTKHLSQIEAFQSSRTFDLIYFDAFSPKEQPELWTEAIFRKMHSLLNEKGMLVTYCAQGQMKRNLKAAGFTVKALKGFAAKREMTVAFR